MSTAAVASLSSFCRRKARCELRSAAVQEDLEDDLEDEGDDGLEDDEDESPAPPLPPQFQAIMSDLLTNIAEGREPEPVAEPVAEAEVEEAVGLAAAANAQGIEGAGAAQAVADSSGNGVAAAVPAAPAPARSSSPLPSPFASSSSSPSAYEPAEEPAFSHSPHGRRYGRTPGQYEATSFCVNCCRPLPAAGAMCGGCGHHPSRDAEVLGDPHAWVQAYEAQLLRQQLHQARERAQAASGSAASSSSSGSNGGGGTGGVMLAADARMLLHRSALPPHPSRPERLQAIMSRLHARGLLPRCNLHACRAATDAELLRVHTPALVAAVRGLGKAAAAAAGSSSQEAAGGLHGAEEQAAAAVGPTSPLPWTYPATAALAADTLYNAHTATAALLAAGAAADLGSALASGRVGRGMALVRPPGAQAGPGQARAGCYLNNTAVAAAAALAAGARRVMILDWDVAHCQGTSEIFANDPRVLVVSLHRFDSETFPGTGAVDDTGSGEGAGTSLNITWGSSGVTDGDLLSAMLHVVMPVALQWRPAVVLASAGFGALKGDTIGGCLCSPAVFGHLTHLLLGAGAPLGLVLEGGTALGATAEGVEACLRVLLGEAPPPLPGPWAASSAGWVGIMNSMQIHSQFYSALHPLSYNGWVSAIANQQRVQERERQQVAMQVAEAEEADAAARYGLSPRSGSFGALAGAGGGWAGLEDEDDSDDDDDDSALGGFAGARARVGEMDALAAVADALRRNHRRSLDGVEDGAPGGSGGAGVLGGVRDEEDLEEAEEQEDGPVGDISPAELLDAFLGTGSGSSRSGSSSRSNSATWGKPWDDLGEGDEGEGGGQQAMRV
ncbi:hypothetical protein HXX76_004464 [Chlamydomonas incerta]|uniref:Histone deacetylase domain-containing protein n=1 Tax=Chlamydomonas incerta TaxID=51695 RepID=A0A835THC7_CHLIN|nr:hypothetical protein HXX76_004464 [Chlamydomonas incerta]|eukprot:KAG2440359.1 hypothetical protein HXX76_004464 [Chlamydomonas incerta]